METHLVFGISNSCLSRGRKGVVGEETKLECLNVKFLPIHRPLSSIGLQAWAVCFFHCLGAVIKRLLNLGVDILV